MKTRHLIKDNPREVLKLLLKRINCNYNEEIYSEMKGHPDFPSFLSFNYILKKRGVDSVALKTNIDDLRFNLPKPILVHVSPNDGMFLLLEKVDDQYAYIIDEEDRLEKEPIDDFLKIWNGYALIVDIENIKEPKTTLIDKTKLFLNQISKPFSIISVSLFLVYFLIFKGKRNVFNILYLFEYGAGILFSVLLLIEHFDKNNLFVKHICHSRKNKKINCGSILNSKAAYFLGIFSWSDIGFIYFVILFLLSLFSPSKLSLSFSVLTSAFIFPYVFYSLYYQKFIARNWCILCLSVQGVIFSIFVTSIFAFNNAIFGYIFIPENIIYLVLLSSSIIAIYIIIKPLIASYVNSYAISQNFKTIKYNNDVKSILFGQQLTYSFNGIEKINIGNSDGNGCVTIIFSPICDPCMLELRKLLPILKTKENTLIEILFLVDRNESTLAFRIAKSMLNIYYQNKETFINTLEEYVNSYPKSKFKFGKYDLKDPISLNIEQIIKNQESWCIKNKIYSTPKIFLNHKELPSVYSFKDIDYLVS